MFLDAKLPDVLASKTMLLIAYVALVIVFIWLIIISGVFGAKKNDKNKNSESTDGKEGLTSGGVMKRFIDAKSAFTDASFSQPSKGKNYLPSEVDGCGNPKFFVSEAPCVVPCSDDLLEEAKESFNSYTKSNKTTDDLLQKTLMMG